MVDDILGIRIGEESGVDDDLLNVQVGSFFEDVSIPVPNKTELVEADYNDALKRLQQSFNELSDTVAQLGGGPSLSLMEAQEAYEEEMLLHAIESGPIYESVKKENKAEVKAIVKKVRKQFGWNKSLANFAKLFPLPKGSDPIIEAWMFFDPVFLENFRGGVQMYSWQSAGILVYHRGKETYQDMCRTMNEKAASILGDKYEIRFLKLRFGFRKGAQWLPISLVYRDELRDDEKNRDQKFFELAVLVIVDEKSAAKETEVKAEVKNPTKFTEYIKSKFSKVKK